MLQKEESKKKKGHYLGYPGRTTTKQLLRRYWFPKINNMIDRITDQCYECKVISSNPRLKSIKIIYTQEKLGDRQLRLWRTIPRRTQQPSYSMWYSPFAAASDLSTSLNQYYSWPVIHLVGPPGYFTFLYGHKRNTTRKVGEKKNKRTIWAYVSSNCKKWGVVTPCIPRASVYNRRRVFFAKLRQKGTNNADIFSR